MRPAHDPMIRMMLNYPFDLPEPASRELFAPNPEEQAHFAELALCGELHPEARSAAKLRLAEISRRESVNDNLEVA